MGVAPSKEIRVLEVTIRLLKGQINQLSSETYKASMDWLVLAKCEEARDNEWVNSPYVDPDVKPDYEEEATARRIERLKRAPSLAIKLMSAAEKIIDATDEAMNSES